MTCSIAYFRVKAHYKVKARKKEPNNVWIVLKNCFLKIEKSPWEHYISKKLYF
jgi:hypothetical protein